jgi:hypothetical protein
VTMDDIWHSIEKALIHDWQTEYLKQIDEGIKMWGSLLDVASGKGKRR